MKVIIHYPAGEKESKELSAFIAELHAESAINHIKKLECNLSQKQDIIARIRENVKDM